MVKVCTLFFPKFVFLCNSYLNNYHLRHLIYSTPKYPIFMDQEKVEFGYCIFITGVRAYQSGEVLSDLFQLLFSVRRRSSAEPLLMYFESTILKACSSASLKDMFFSVSIRLDLQLNTSILFSVRSILAASSSRA